MSRVSGIDAALSAIDFAEKAQLTDPSLDPMPDVYNSSDVIRNRALGISAINDFEAALGKAEALTIPQLADTASSDVGGSLARSFIDPGSGISEDAAPFIADQYETNTAFRGAFLDQGAQLLQNSKFGGENLGFLEARAFVDAEIRSSIAELDKS